MALPVTTYTCTATPSCKLTFTDFTQWANHELSFHSTAWNIWYCHSLDANCKLGFNTQADFKSHWQATHARDEHRNKRKLATHYYQLGPVADEQYWCGFCKTTLSCNMTRSWSVDRMEHVAGHFMAAHPRLEHFEIEEWEYIQMHDPTPETE